MYRVAVIGGGIAGSGVGIYLQNMGIEVDIFEKQNSLVSGPPMCHLHAGGNLYPEISDEQCLTLLEESIELLKFFPQAIDFRPTVVCVQKEVNVSLEKIFNRIEKLKNRYKTLVQEDETNKVLGEIEDYYKIYSKDELLKLKNRTYKKPTAIDDWLIPFVQNVDLNSIKYPVILVQEYGLNVFRIAALAKILLKNVYLNSEVINITKLNNTWEVVYTQNGKIVKKRYDYIVNSAGYETGKIDDMLGIKKDRFTEFKAAYVVKWRDDIIFPEIVFLGERGTPKGMGQFTPYYGGYYQLHSMTKDITLFENGLVKTDENSSYPKLDETFVEKIKMGWGNEFERSQRAVNYLKKFIPSFDAKIGYKPLYGAQQIPGKDESLRAAEVSFEDNYARCEIVKASSILKMADEIAKKLGINTKHLEFKVEKELVDEIATNLAWQRGYPRELGKVINSQK